MGSALDIPAWSASPPGVETSPAAEQGKLLSAFPVRGQIHEGAVGGSALDVGWSSPFSLRRVDQLLFKVDTPPFLGISGREIPHRLGQLCSFPELCPFPLDIFMYTYNRLTLLYT